MRMTLKTIIKIGDKSINPRSGAVRQKWRDETGNYYVTSAVRNGWASETLMFNSDDSGDVTDWTDIGNSVYGDHEGAVRDAGFVIVGEF